MECPARMIGEPFEDVGLFVGGIVCSTMAWMIFSAGTARSTALRKQE